MFHGYRDLAGLAFGIFVAGAGGMVAIKVKSHRKLNQAEYIQEPFRILKEYPHAEELFGEKFIKKNLNLSDPFNWKNDKYAQIVIPVIGTRNHGMLYTWLSNIGKEDESGEKTEEKWRVDRADIMLPHHKVPVTFYKHPGVEYIEKIKFEEKDFLR